MFVVTMIMLATMLPTFASAAEVELMRYEPCSKCGVGFVSERIVEGSSMEVERRVCIHHLDGVDVKYKTLRTRRWSCSSCGWFFEEEISPVYEWKCEGY